MNAGKPVSDMPLTPALFPGTIEHLSDHQLLYCHVHKQAVPYNQLDAHLRREHHLDIRLRRPLMVHCATLDVIANPEDILPCADHSPVLPILPLQPGAYSCNHCRYLTTNRDVINRHLNTVHAIYRSACRTNYQRVTVQSWYPPGTRAKYWIVYTSQDELTNPRQPPQGKKEQEKREQEKSELKLFEPLEQLEKEEIERLALQDEENALWDAEVEQSDTTPWLQYTKWPQQFANRPIEIIAATAQQPCLYPTEEYVLGFWNGVAIASPMVNEVRIQTILSMLGDMFDRCQQTLDASSYQLRCWVKSFTHSSLYPYPLKRHESKATEQRYINLWKRFFCYIFRVWTMSEEARSEIYGLVFSKQQEMIISRIWQAMDENTTDYMGSEQGEESEEETEGQSESETASIRDDHHKPTSEVDYETSQITEWLFALSCQFVAQISQPSREASLPLVHFVGVLGIHSYNLVYRTAYAFTPTIAGLIWICRLLMLEYALPVAQYQDLCWPDRESYDDQIARMHSVRRKFLCRGGFHPTACLIEALLYGRRIARKEGARTNVSWSSNKDTLILYEQRVTMSAFRQMVWCSVHECQNMLTRAMFHWSPGPTDLAAIADDLTEDRPGWSFLKNPKNGLQLSFRHLHRRAFVPEALMKSNRWSVPRCRQYLSQVEELKQQLLVCIHLTGGMPGRGSEITTIKWCNTRHTMRNIFVYHGRLMVLIEYNKTRASTNNAFYIARILPLTMSRVLFQYLAYVRPFCDTLRHQLQLASHSLNTHYLFTSKDQLYTSDTLTKLISQQAKKAGAGSLTIATYRQSVLAIAKQHITQIARPFDLEHPLDSDDPYLGIARQSGHRVQTLLESYALDRAYPARLQPELLAQYQRVSQSWHSWLELEKLDVELQVKVKMGEVQEDGEKSKKRKFSGIESPKSHSTSIKRLHTARSLQSKQVQVSVPSEVLDALRIVATYYNTLEVE
jgi:Orsellinic acid/F9775 biosynthesis cluster protein D